MSKVEIGYSNGSAANGSAANGSAANGSSHSNGASRRSSVSNSSSTGSHGSCLVLDSNPNLTPQQYLLSLIQLPTLSKCVELLVVYDIANNITSTHATPIATLVKRLGYDEGNLQRILSLVSSHGILREVADGYLGTELSDLLRDDFPNSIADLVRQYCRREMQLALIDMGSCLTTGTSAFASASGSSYYDYLNKQPEAEQVFDRAVAKFSEPMQNKLVYSLYNFSPYATVAEIGGGRGGLIEKILRQNTNTSGVLFERHAVIPNIMPELRAPPVRERFQAIGGDARISIDVEAELFIISNMLADFSTQDATAILHNVAKAMAKSQQKGGSSTFLLVEPDFIQNATNEPSLAKRGMDLVAMYLLGGQPRTDADYQNLLEKSGYTIQKMIRIPPFFTAYECQLA